MASPTLSRPAVEQIVREVIYARFAAGGAKPALAPNSLVVNVSARHCHVTQEALEALFGKGHQLTPVKDLYQKGYFAAQECVTLIGPKSRIISNLRILGPCRSINQVELAFTDAIMLGFDVPVRISGDIKDTPGCMLMGPKGFFEMKEGVIRAKRHVHMSLEDAAFYGVKQGDAMKLRVGGECGATFDNIMCRVDKTVRLEVHLDTDEGNAVNLAPDSQVELLK